MIRTVVLTKVSTENNNLLRPYFAPVRCAHALQQYVALIRACHICHCLVCKCAKSSSSLMPRNSTSNRKILMEIDKYQVMTCHPLLKERCPNVQTTFV